MKKDLHTIHNKYPEYKNFYLTYNYNSKTSEWEFKGYRCIKCDRVLHRNQNGVPKHNENCKEINRVKKYKTVEIDKDATVLDVEGKVWEPLDFNQFPA